MVESKAVPETNPKLSAAERLKLIQTLNALPLAQFEELLIALNPPKGNIPTDTAAQAIRSKALFEWIESPIGPGIPELENLLGLIIATHSQKAQELISFAISGKINSTTTAEVRAIVELLRKKTGDNSIDVAFFEEGSINMILSGSPEGLKQLQKLFESGELRYLRTPSVESVHSVSDSTASARKARLIQVLRLTSNSSVARERDLDLDQYLEHYLNLTSTSASALKRALEGLSDFDLRLILGRIGELVSYSTSAHDLTSYLARHSDCDIERYRKLASYRDRDLVVARDLARDLTHDLANYRNLANYRDLANYLARELSRFRYLIRFRFRASKTDRRLALNHADLTYANLNNIDLRQIDLTEADFTGADLSEANLIGANLTRTDFTGADVTETIFGDNLGLTAISKQNLQRRGAILQDPPSSDILSLVSVR